MTNGPVDPARDAASGMPRWVKVCGIVGIVAVAGVTGVMLLGGGEHGPGRHGSPGHGVPAAGGPAPAEEATRVVEVTALDTLTFDPTGVTVSAGETVTFVVTNTGQTAHDFTLGDAAMQQEQAGAMAHGMAHDMANSVMLQPGETKRLTWRFAEAGTVEYGCHTPGHYEAGMRGQVMVQ